MSAFIGFARGPDHNSPDSAVEVWCSKNRVEVVVLKSIESLDPIAARNLAALLVRASEEAEKNSAIE